jgi:hypothetical protein
LSRKSKLKAKLRHYAQGLQPLGLKRDDLKLQRHLQKSSEQRRHVADNRVVQIAKSLAGYQALHSSHVDVFFSKMINLLIYHTLVGAD